MKKITLLLFVLTLVLASCQNKNAYTIDGNFTENTFEGKTIYLQKIDSMNAESSTVIDSAVIKNNAFIFKGATDDIIMGFLSVGRLENPEPNFPVASLILEPGAIKITFDKKDVTVAGTPKNDDFNKVLLVMNKRAALYEEVNKAGGVIQSVPLDAEGKDPQARMMALQEDMKKYSFEFTKANMGNKAGQLFFYSSAANFTREQLAELIPLADSSFRNQPQIKALEKELSKIVPAVGQPFADVQLTDANGASIALSTYVGKNKCVLVDFWASWCAPCLQEMPGLVKTYSAYKGKGLEIVGISVDEDKEAWLSAVKTHKMAWIQLADDTRAASEAYGVQSIPHTILIDQNGVIVAKDLRGQALEDKIAELLK